MPTTDMTEDDYPPENCIECGEKLDGDGDFCMECGYPHFHDEELTKRPAANIVKGWCDNES